MNMPSNISQIDVHNGIKLWKPVNKSACTCRHVLTNSIANGFTKKYLHGNIF